jgi:glycosyltransferase involved in cell wall biosynthesis
MNINIIGPINQLGYGITSLNIVKELSKFAEVSLFMIGQPQVTNQEDADIVSKCIQNSHFFDVNAPSIKIWHQHDMAQSVGRGTRIGFPIFELDQFNSLEKHQLSSLDIIFVCSEWAKSVICNNIKSVSKNKVIVIPLGVDLSIFKPSTMINGGPTKFFNCGKWEIRKGHDLLVNLFNDAFNEDDNVELHMMCTNPFCSEQEELEWINLYKNSKLGHKIHIIPRQDTQHEVYNIMSTMHCGVFPARAEGWNLELLEMMACGKHVITTNYSAHTEFCNEDNALLMPIKSSEIAYDGKWFHGQGNWAKIDDNARGYAIQHMRKIYNSHQNNQLLLNNSGIETANRFNWQNTGRKILNAIQLLKK